MAKTVTGVSFVFVNCKDGSVLQVNEGEEIPAGVSTAELKRLDELNVFGVHPREEAKERLDAMVAAGLASHGLAEVERSDEEKRAHEDGSGDDDDEPSAENDFGGLQIPELTERLHSLAGYEDVPIPDDVTREQLVDFLAQAEQAEQSSRSENLETPEKY